MSPHTFNVFHDVGKYVLNRLRPCDERQANEIPGSTQGYVVRKTGFCSLNGKRARIVHPDPVAFAALGLAGLFKKYPLLGVATGIAGRFLAHFTSGVWFFGIYAPEGMHPIVYSAIYNGSYLLIELIISTAIIYILIKPKLLEIYL